MSKARDRADRKGVDPVNIGNARLALDSAGSSDLKVTAQDGSTLKKVFAEQIQLGTGANRVIIKKNASTNKFQFQSTDGSSTSAASVGTGVVTNPSDLPLSGNSAGDTRFVTSNNNLMIHNGSGWYKVATVTNSSPTISSAGNASYGFATDGTPVSIEITASDPEGIALQYKYTVSSGSIGSTAAVTSSATSGGTYSALAANTLTSNKYFKVTPSTNTAHAGSFSLTFSASDGVNVANSSASSFTLGFATYGSVNVDGTGDWVTGTVAAAGTNDFTLEAWANWDTISHSGVVSIHSSLNASAVNGFAFARTNGTGYQVYYGNTYTTSTIGSDPIAGTWYHLALVRISNVLKLYINGAESFSVSDSTNYTQTILQIGGYYSASYLMDGKIADVRYVVGTGVYTGDFTPPSGALTKTGGTYPSSTNVNTSITSGHTKLLTANRNNAVTDDSTSSVSLTKAGNAAENASNPYPGNTVGYGSLYFDGTGDKVITPTSSDYAMGTGAFTIEMWYQPKSDTNSGGNARFLCDLGSNGIKLTILSGLIRLKLSGETQITHSIGSLDQSQWYHVAATRDSSGNVKLYHDGIVVASYSSSTYNHTSTQVTIGDHGGTGYPFTGSISNLRIVKGSTVYTPTSLSGYSGSIHMNGGTLSSNGIGGSYTMGTGDFTIETWFKYTGPSSLNSNDYLFDLGTSNDIRVTFGGGNINVDDGSQVFSYGANPIDTARWYHLAYVRTGGISSLYLDGNLKASIGGSNYNHAESTFTLGNYGGGGSYVWNGYLTDFRIVKGKAVYTGNFTRPSGPLTKTGGTYPSSTNISNPTASQTVLLIGNNSSSITDASDTGHTLTPSGSISASSDVPAGDSFIVPTSPLTAVTNTELLTCQRSSAGYTSINSASTKFAGITGTSNNGYTYIDSPSDSALQLGNADWTIEFWINTGDMGDTQLPFDYNYPASQGSGMMMYITSTGMLTAYQGAEVLRSDGTYLPLMQKHTWYHVALVRHSSVLRMYQNGAKCKNSSGVGTANGDHSYTTNLTNQRITIGVKYFGGHDTWPCRGYISDFRIVVGTAVYTGDSFTLPTSALTKITNTQLLTCQTSSGTITDQSDNNFTMVVGSGATPSSYGAKGGLGITDQSSDNRTMTAVGNTSPSRSWPFNYDG